MLSTAAHLHTRRPSPTTTEYTVSTLPAPNLPLRLLLVLVNLTRLLLGLSVLLLLYAKWTLSPYTTPSTPEQPPGGPDMLSAASVEHVLNLVLHAPPGRLALRLALATPSWLLLPGSLLTLYLTLRRIHTSESLLVLRGLGIQTSSTASTVLGSAVTRFIPTEKIQDVLINEAFRGFEVRYYLVVVVEDEEDVVVVFPKLLPRREAVERVWRGVRACLFEEDRGRNGEKNGKAVV
ncbi:GPI-GlcNAc transferase complex [Xylariales sp. AK1849]|nr:GPI-GlcNAc transferase complex [Xylariales sp. AK1849]